MRTILVAADGSEHAMRAAKFAVELANDSKHPITVVIACAVPAPGAWQILPYQNAAELEKEFNDAGNKIVEPVVALMKEANITHGVYLGKDSPAECIARLVKEQHCDAVVMGARGTSRARDLVLGSVVSKVCHLVDVPVIVVK
jgi:nucleotide-binding universal stress UspA family protein